MDPKDIGNTIENVRAWNDHGGILSLKIVMSSDDFQGSIRVNVKWLQQHVLQEQGNGAFP